MDAPTAEVESLTANVESLTADVESLTADVESPTDDVEFLIANVESQTADLVVQIADVDDPTATRQPPPHTTAFPTCPLSPSLLLRLRQIRVDLLAKRLGAFEFRVLTPPKLLEPIPRPLREG